MRKIVSQGEIIPHGYDIAWRAWERDVAVCYPIPLHAILGWLRCAYIWLRFQTAPHALSNRIRVIVRHAEREAYARGYERANLRKDSFRAGWEAAFARIEADLGGVRGPAQP